MLKRLDRDGSNESTKIFSSVSLSSSDMVPRWHLLNFIAGDISSCSFPLIIHVAVSKENFLGVVKNLI